MPIPILGDVSVSETVAGVIALTTAVCTAMGGALAWFAKFMGQLFDRFDRAVDKLADRLSSATADQNEKLDAIREELVELRVKHITCGNYAPEKKPGSRERKAAE